MILREYKARDSQNKNRVFVDLECDHCYSVYTRQKRQLKISHGCSQLCLSFLNGTRVKVTCAHCNIKFDKRRSELAKSKSGLYFCSQVCHNEASRYNEAIRPAHYGDGNYRDRALRAFGKICNRCGFNNLDALEVHHRDRNKENNDLDNLEVLCANCHALEHRGRMY